MKIQADRAELAAALSWAAIAIPRKTQTGQEIMAGIRLVADADQLTAEAFDGNVGHTVVVSADVHKAGTALVSGRFLAMIVEGFKAETITLELDGPNLIIKSGRSTYRARTMKPDQYPTLPTFGTKVGHIDAEELMRLIRVTGGPIDDASDRQALAGLHLEADVKVDPALWAVGSDDQGRSLHVYQAEWKGYKGKRSVDVTVPAGPFAAAARGMSGTIDIGLDGSLVGLRDEVRTVILRPYASEYFGGRWRNLLEVEPVAVIECDRAELAGALARAGMVGESRVGIKVEPDQISVSAGADIGDGEDIIDATGDTGNGAIFGMNTELLGMALASVDTERVSIGLPKLGTIMGKAIDIRPVGQSGTRCLVMPRKWDR
jgi:DNA polymerase III sliding clamp (beta) subunit (PCNA family)